MYGENYDKYEQLKRQYEREDHVVVNKNEMEREKPLERPGAMRAWLNKWDPDFNTGFKQVGTQSDTPNN